MSITERFKNGWDAFLGRAPTWKYDYGPSYATRPDRVRISYTNIRSIIPSIQNRIAVDAAQVNVWHVRLDDKNEMFKERIDDGLQWALTRSANVDQTGRSLLKDAVFSMLDEGCIAIVPTVTSNGDPNYTDSYTIRQLRVAKIIEWFPNDVRVDIYNDHTGDHVQMIFPKRYVAIVENPFYQIMNEPNSTLQQLKSTLRILDDANSQVGSHKLDLLIQLPYELRSPIKKREAKRRLKELESQMSESKLGVGYVDATERVIQLNRSLENNLWTQVRDLQEDLYNQMGITRTVFDGTADEQTMLNYNNRTIEPILTAITESMEKSWLSQTAVTQHQAIRYYRDPFKLMPSNQIAENADKLTRNEIMTSNEIRTKLGLSPSDDPKANELRNSNLNHPDEGVGGAEVIAEESSNRSVNLEEIVGRISK